MGCVGYTSVTGTIKSKHWMDRNTLKLKKIKQWMDRNTLKLKKIIEKN
jgi:hypothetical protein